MADLVPPIKRMGSADDKVGTGLFTSLQAGHTTHDSIFRMER